MKRILSIVLMLAICLSAASTATAYESGDPCLLYGYDPDTRDDYETYGDEVFFSQNRELKSPYQVITIYLNKYASQRIVQESYIKGSTSDIINEAYFPELDICQLYTILNNPDHFSKLNYSYLNGHSQIVVTIWLNEWTNEYLRKIITALSPRIDVDIEKITYSSYDLNDVVTILKHIAGWEGYGKNISKEMKENLIYLDKGEEGISLIDAAHILRVIAGWDMLKYFGREFY